MSKSKLILFFVLVCFISKVHAQDFLFNNYPQHLNYLNPASVGVEHGCHSASREPVALNDIGLPGASAIDQVRVGKTELRFGLDWDVAEWRHLHGHRIEAEKLH